MAHLKGIVRIVILFTVVIVVAAIVWGGTEICAFFVATLALVFLFLGSPLPDRLRLIVALSPYSPQAPRAPPLH
jgi:hypothetical protein